jgi:lipase chaperone LimK
VSSPRRSGWIVAVLTLACVGLIIRHGHSGRTISTHVDAAQSATASNGVPRDSSTSGDMGAPIEARNPQQILQQGSLRDTVTDGDVSIGFGGHLKPDLALRRLFDYYLTLNGETDLTSIRVLLQRDLLHRRLAEPMVDEVMQTFDDYIRYQQSAANLASRPDLDLKAQLAQLQALREQILGDSVAKAFYSIENAQQALLLQRLALESNRDLSPTQKSLRLQTLDAAMPMAEREARTEASVGQLVQQQTALLDDAHADPATRHAERADVWGDTVANRLAVLDQQRAQWQARLDVYSSQRERIQHNDDLDGAARQTALQKLLQSSFHGTEQLQVQAMARSGVLSPVAR